jgi:enoyl-CoA hydratase
VIERAVRGSVAVLRLAHQKASALDLELLRALASALDAERASSERALVLTGTGSIFSAGVDLYRVTRGGRAYLAEFLPALDEALFALFAFEKPAVAAINGHAIAGGCILALACDRRVIARGDATIGVPELRVGVPFPPSALEIVRSALAPREFHELVFSGRNLRGADIVARGLAEEAVEPEHLLDRAILIAEELAAVPPEAFAIVKRATRAPAIERMRRETLRMAPAILDAWSSKPVLAAIESYVARTLRK